MLKSRRKSSDQILGVIKRSTAERFLCELANLQPIPATVQRLCSRYPQMFTGDADPAETAGVLWQLLQRAWDAPEARKRDWYCHQMETYYHRLRPDRDLKASLGPAMARSVLGDSIEPGSLLFSLQEPPAAPSPLEAALFYFKRNAEHLRHCPNPECPAPYFFTHKKGQKFCSEICAKPTQRASKLRWWHENRGK